MIFFPLHESINSHLVVKMLLTLWRTQQVQFDRYLSSPDTLVMPQLNFLLSAAIK